MGDNEVIRRAPEADPALRERVEGAATDAERVEIQVAAGLTTPDPEPTNEELLAGVDGSGIDEPAAGPSNQVLWFL